MARGQRLRPPPVEENAGVRGDSFAAEFGGAEAVTEATGTTSGGFTAGITNAPPKASAAPVAGTENLFTGLCAALNQFQEQLNSFYMVLIIFHIHLCMCALCPYHRDHQVIDNFDKFHLMFS